MEKIKLIDFEKRKLKRCYLSLLFFTQQIKVRTEGCFAIKTLYILLGTDIGGK